MSTDMTREEHLKWCKERALAYLTEGDLQNAFNSMLSDMKKHPKTADHAALGLGVMLHLGGHLNTYAAMRRFIAGFN